jgi:dTMP kinase
LAYQGYARGLSLAMVRRLNAVATGGLKPDLTIVLDIPDSEFGFRDKLRRRDRVEREPARFRRLVRDGYRALSRRQRRVVLLNGRRPLAELHRDIAGRVEALL